MAINEAAKFDYQNADEVPFCRSTVGAGQNIHENFFRLFALRCNTLAFRVVLGVGSNLKIGTMIAADQHRSILIIILEIKVEGGEVHEGSGSSFRIAGQLNGQSGWGERGCSFTPVGYRAAIAAGSGSNRPASIGNQ
jgi:hypothetical protein